MSVGRASDARTVRSGRGPVPPDRRPGWLHGLDATGPVVRRRSARPWPTPDAGYRRIISEYG